MQPDTPTVIEFGDLEPKGCDSRLRRVHPSCGLDARPPLFRSGKSRACSADAHNLHSAQKNCQSASPNLSAGRINDGLGGIPIWRRICDGKTRIAMTTDSHRTHLLWAVRRVSLGNSGFVGHPPADQKNACSRRRGHGRRCPPVLIPRVPAGVSRFRDSLSRGCLFRPMS